MNGTDPARVYAVESVCASQSVTGSPLLLPGAVNATVICALPRVAVPMHFGFVVGSAGDGERFLAEAIDEVEDARIVEDIRGRLEGWLARHAASPDTV